jgi:hypothetical protein
MAWAGRRGRVDLDGRRHDRCAVVVADLGDYVDRHAMSIRGRARIIRCWWRHPRTQVVFWGAAPHAVLLWLVLAMIETVIWFVLR